MHTSHQTTHSPQITKSVPTQITENKTNTNIKHKFFEELVPSVLPMLKKAHKARTRWYCGPLRRFINTRFKKVLKKGMDSSSQVRTLISTIVGKNRPAAQHCMAEFVRQCSALCIGQCFVTTHTGYSVTCIGKWSVSKLVPQYSVEVGVG